MKYSITNIKYLTTQELLAVVLSENGDVENSKELVLELADRLAKVVNRLEGLAQSHNDLCLSDIIVRYHDNSGGTQRSL